MIAMLEPLAELPGVELVMLVTHDGVPVAVPGRAAKEGDPEASNLVMGKEDGIGACAVGRAQYTCWCDERGFVQQDGVALRIAPDEYRLTAAEPTVSWQDLPVI